MKLDESITFSAEHCGSCPCFRGLRIRVADVLEMIAEGAIEITLLADLPDFGSDDASACLHFAGQRTAFARFVA